MPLTFEIDHEKRFVHIDTEGVVTLADILVGYEGLVSGDALTCPKLFEASNRLLQLGSEDLMTLGAFSRHDPRGPIAPLYTSEENENTLSRSMNLRGAKRPIKLSSRAPAR